MRRTVCLLAVFAGLTAASPAVLAASADVMATPIEKFSAESDATTFGQLEYLGGLVLTSANPEFQSLSSVRFLPDGRHFIAVADTGQWIDGTIERDADGKLVGLSDVTVNPMKNTDGLHPGKSDMDAESLSIIGDRVLVGFENKHRIDSYPLHGHEDATATRGPAYLIAPHELRANGSFEALATNASGKTVLITEKSIDQDGNLFAAIIEGPRKGIFKVVKRQDFDITDAAFLPDGDLLVLERRFSLMAGVAMRIRRLSGDQIEPGAVVDGPVIMQADGRRYEIDNMEGMDAITMPDGSVHLIIVSDDNNSLFQKTLMLEFRLLQ